MKRKSGESNVSMVEEIKTRSVLLFCISTKSVTINKKILLGRLICCLCLQQSIHSYNHPHQSSFIGGPQWVAVLLLSRMCFNIVRATLIALIRIWQTYKEEQMCCALFHFKPGRHLCQHVPY